MGEAHFLFRYPLLREDAPQWGAVVLPRNAPQFIWAIVQKRRGGILPFLKKSV
jgi:hypothetical protein